MTLAYVFWHRPAQSAVGYAEALRGFHSVLGSAGVQGFETSWSAVAADLPWHGSGQVYEDRYLVADFAALGPLNEAAVSARQRSAHDAAAAQARYGTAGLYALISGEADPRARQSWWFDKPAGMSYAQLRDALGTPDGALWQRQLTLGPGPEFQLIGPRPPAFQAHGAALEPV